MNNLLKNYKIWVEKQNRKYYHSYDYYFQPYFKWNPFDTRNDWQPDWLGDWVLGWFAFYYAWELWVYWMKNDKCEYELPETFWIKLNG